MNSPKQEQIQDKLIVGLGNPASEYKNTRHNIGFTVLDTFSKKHKVQTHKENKFLSLYGKKAITLNNSTKVYNLTLVWPTTFMNKSGEAVAKILNYFKLDPKSLIVVHDDVALNLGKIRISYDSGAAGHHGVESIIQYLEGFQEFIRLRIGVGPDPGGDKRADYVLEKFSETEKTLLERIITLSIEAIELIITKGAHEAMNKFNGINICNNTNHYT